MKKTRFFLMALLLVAMMIFTGCGSDDQNQNTGGNDQQNGVEQNVDDNAGNNAGDNADKNGGAADDNPAGELDGDDMLPGGGDGNGGDLGEDLKEGVDDISDDVEDMVDGNGNNDNTDNGGQTN